MGRRMKTILIALGALATATLAAATLPGSGGAGDDPPLLIVRAAGALIDTFGYVNFYLLTTVLALPGIVLFWWMSRTGLIDASMGTAGEVSPEPDG